MPKLNLFKVRVETAERGPAGQVKFNINNHKVPFENPKGGTRPGDTFEGEFEINSFAHTLNLVGPEQGEWDIKSVTVHYDCEAMDPYEVKFGAVTLDETTELDIWQDPPAPVFDV